MKGSKVMKKCIALILVLMIALSLCACGSGKEDPADNDTAAATKTPETTSPTDDNQTTAPTEPSQGNEPVISGYTFTHNGVKFGLDMNVAQVLTGLGAYDDRSETESCAFGGMDVDYYYPDFTIYTNTEQGFERIYCIELTSDMVATEEGVSLFQDASAITAAYGEAASSTETGMIYEKDGMTLTFLLEKGKITSIQYYIG